MLQTGPASGVDKVKKGGSYMCIKVNSVIITSFFLLFCLLGKLPFGTLGPGMRRKKKEEEKVITVKK